MRRLVVGLVALIAFGALGGYVAGAVTKGKPAAASQGSLASVVVVRSDAQSAVDVATPLAVPSATIRLTVPKGHQDLFDVRFSGVASFPNGPAFPVAVDVTVDGIAMPPSGLPAWQTAAVAASVPTRTSDRTVERGHVRHRDRALGRAGQPPVGATPRLDARVAAHDRVGTVGVRDPAA